MASPAVDVDLQATMAADTSAPHASSQKDLPVTQKGAKASGSIEKFKLPVPECDNNRPADCDSLSSYEAHAAASPSEPSNSFPAVVPPTPFAFSANTDSPGLAGQQAAFSFACGTAAAKGQSSANSPGFGSSSAADPSKLTEAASVEAASVEAASIDFVGSAAVTSTELPKPQAAARKTAAGSRVRSPAKTSRAQAAANKAQRSSFQFNTNTPAAPVTGSTSTAASKATSEYQPTTADGQNTPATSSAGSASVPLSGPTPAAGHGLGAAVNGAAPFGHPTSTAAPACTSVPVWSSSGAPT